MKALVRVSCASIFVLFAPSACFAVWGIAPISKERAQEFGVQVRPEAAGENQVGVELDFSAENEFKNFSRVELQFGEVDNVLIFAPCTRTGQSRGASWSNLLPTAPKWIRSPCA